MNIIYQVPISSLPAWDKNPRQIDDDNLKRLARSIQEYTATMKGWKIKNGYRLVDPIIFNARLKHVTGGHQRLQALEKVLHQTWVHKDDIRTIDADPVTDAALNIALNNPNLQGRWELELLQADLDFIILETDNDLGDLTVPSLDLESTGFDKNEYLQLFPQGLDVEEDMPPALPDKARTSRGQVYRLGPHRVMCGDATNPEDMEKLMAGKQAAILFTSPPYNLGRSAKFRGKSNIAKMQNAYGRGYDDDIAPGKWKDLMCKFTSIGLNHARYLFINVQLLAGNRVALPDWWSEFKDQFCDVAIWEKDSAPPQMQERVMNNQFEFILIFTKTHPNRMIGTRKFKGNLSNVYRAPPQRNNRISNIHGATFPVHFPSYFISSFTNPGESILDTFGGSGTTLIAAEQLGRVCYIMEIDPRYVDVIVDRYRNFQKRHSK